MRGVALRSPMLILLLRYLLLPCEVRSHSSPPPPLDPGAEGGSLPPFDPGAEGGSLPPGQGILPRFVAAPLPVPVARDPLPDPRGRSRLPLVAAPPPAAPPDSDEVSPGVAGMAPGLCQGGVYRQLVCIL